MFKKIFILSLGFLFLLSANIAFAYNASQVLGQTLFTTSASGATSTSMDVPRDVEYDSDDNLLYVLDYVNNRVLVFNVADITSGEAAVNVLGQNDFTTSAASTNIDRLSEPAGLALDSERDLLFVSQASDRISIFDVSTITDGEDAVNFLGFGTDVEPESTSPGTAQNSFDIGSGAVAGMHYDETNELLYLADIGNHRVLVFNMSVIVDAEDAVNVIGQIAYGGGNVAAGTHPSGLSSPSYVSYIEDLNYLAVSDSACLSFFDVSSITDGEDAVRAIGSNNLACDGSGGATTGRNGFFLGFPYGSANDNTKNVLYVADGFQGIRTFDSTAITTGEDAVSIISQDTFDDIVIETSQSRPTAPVSTAVDEANNRLFVADQTGNRVMVFEFMNVTDSGVLLDGTVGAAYTDTVETENSQGTIELSLVSGSLPDGVTLGANGVISGTPTTEGDYSFTLRVNDMVIDDVQEFSDTQLFSMSVAAAPPSGGGGGDGGGSSGSKIRGCMDMFALNFNSRAVIDNGSCRYAEVPQTPTAPTITCPVFTGYAKIWDRNNDKNEVVRIQNFLNENMGERLKADGTFGLGTYFAVKRFQEKYYSQIIVPWVPVNGLDHSTGWWHKTTSAWANNLLGCPISVSL